METLQNIIIKAHYLDVPYHKNLRKVFKLKKNRHLYFLHFFLSVKNFCFTDLLGFNHCCLQRNLMPFKSGTSQEIFPFPKKPSIKLQAYFSFCFSPKASVLYVALSRMILLMKMLLKDY